MTNKLENLHAQISKCELPFARTLLHLPVVDSTNDLARALLIHGRADTAPDLGRQAGPRPRSWQQQLVV